MADDSFRCVKCKQHVDTPSFGTTQRNHCPQCLWSRHVDNFPGDRRRRAAARWSRWLCSWRRAESGC
ncbi:RNHCP domain-containing protein [Candidatus Amarobacter glycogenicus]|uniref:RNHCP domain-containing protein n=1 Tax=Candidatus Amarobacter glycogenicus TaxID=3140699 RepID=UPI0031CC5018